MKSPINIWNLSSINSLIINTNTKIYNNVSVAVIQ